MAYHHGLCYIGYVFHPDHSFSLQKMKALHIMLKHNLTVRQTLVIHLLSVRGLTASEMAEQSRQRASTMMNAADMLAERLLVKRSKERYCRFVYRLTESGMQLAKLLLDAEMPAVPVAQPNTDLIIPGIFS